jgi:hypothetical protein
MHMHNSVSAFLGFWEKIWHAFWDANHAGLQVFSAYSSLFIPLQDYTVMQVAPLEAGYRIDVKVDTAGPYLGARMSFWSPTQPAALMFDEKGERVYKPICPGLRFGIRMDNENQGRERVFFFIEELPKGVTLS